jgi:prepilin-type N-terminal cleavage/methylation domain-containing protein
MVGLRRQGRNPSARGGFTLIELLVVLFIMVILVAAAMYSMRGVSDSGKFNQALNDISGVLEEGRAYANAQDTYVWVCLYQNTPASNTSLDVYAAAYASNDGTDPLNWAGTVTLPTPATSGSTTFRALTKLYHFTGVHLVTDTSLIPSITPNAAFPASTPTFQTTTPSSSGTVTLPSASSGASYWVIQFTPNGMARTSASPVSAIWMGLQPAHGTAALDNKNVAGIEVNGLTGLSTIFRQ